MRRRESHRKSRNGCQNCKRRHVKCDEQGPPCANCVARKITETCSSSNSSTAVSITPPEDEVSPSSGAIIPTPPQDVVSHPSPASQQVSQPRSLLPAQAQRILELELMHRWSTHTWKSLYCVPEDEKYLQITLPRGALRYDFLLHGIFAIAALEIAMCDADVNASLYACAAIEHYDKASESFRAELSNVNSENHHFLLFFSVLAALINMAIPQALRCAGGDVEEEGALARMIILFDLLNASTSLALLDYMSLFDSPFGPSMFSALSLLQDIPAPHVDASEEEAFARLRSMARYWDEVHSTQGNDTLGDTVNPQDVLKEDDPSSRRSYALAVHYLHYCYLQDHIDKFKSFFAGFPSMAGPAYIRAVKNMEPMALFITMHWGVLLDRQASKTWWAVSVGRELVADLVDLLSGAAPEPSLEREWAEGIAWAREQVGLDGLIYGEALD